MPGHLAELISQWGFPCLMFDGAESEQADAEATRFALGELWPDPPHLYVFDHYGLGVAAEQILRTRSAIAVIDDLADRRHDCDLLVDVSHGEDEAHVYQKLLPAACRLLIGQKYMLLRQEFVEIPQVPRTISKVARLLVTLGGNDPLDFTSLALAALAPLAAAGLMIDVTTGHSNPRREQLISRVSSMRNVTLHIQHPRPSELMQSADLCLAAGGMTVWECCYLGLPTLVVRMADNQIGSCEILRRTGAARVLGDGRDLDAAQLHEAVGAAIADADWRLSASRIGQALIDGKGIESVSGELIKLLGISAERASNEGRVQ